MSNGTVHLFNQVRALEAEVGRLRGKESALELRLATEKARNAEKEALLGVRACVLNELEVQLVFWRQCAEQAIDRLDGYEDGLEAARAELCKIEPDVDTIREVMGWTNDDEPPVDIVRVSETFTIGADGNVSEAALTLVEDDNIEEK